MRIWIDIGHPAQLNFYINSIKVLSEDNQVFVTLLDRGKLLKIAEKELKGVQNCTLLKKGKHSGTKWSTIVEGNFIRFFKLCSFYLKYKPKIAVGNGFIHGLVGSIFRIPVLSFSDDIERKIPFLLMRRLSSELYYVTGSNKSGELKGITVFNALKEWSYLSPNYFQPDKSVLEPYGLDAGNYIFVREVITGTLNYQSQSSDLIATVATQFPKNTKVLLSLENKRKIDRYPRDWILLEEPISDIHSLMFHSKLVVSSGDSMAREGSMLGVPSIYCGVREMKANSVMIEKGMLYHVPIDDLPIAIEKILIDNRNENQVEFRESLNNEWIDATAFILNRIKNLEK